MMRGRRNRKRAPPRKPPPVIAVSDPVAVQPAAERARAASELSIEIGDDKSGVAAKVGKAGEAAAGATATANGDKNGKAPAPPAAAAAKSAKKPGAPGAAAGDKQGEAREIIDSYAPWAGEIFGSGRGPPNSKALELISTEARTGKQRDMGKLWVSSSSCARTWPRARSATARAATSPTASASCPSPWAASTGP
jgi:hypothetical protein